MGKKTTDWKNETPGGNVKMSFGGGGGGALPDHEHTAIPLDGGPLDFVNTTIASLSAGSITYSSGAALQELPIGAGGTVLSSSGGIPAWVANTSSPLIEVNKTFSDIDAGTASMDIYTLPSDAALVNIWTDITTVFDLSTAVTIGDGANNSGWIDTTDWTSGTGLTDGTRGAYVTNFQTMRSVTGTTAIKGYNFGTAGGSFTQALGGTAHTMSQTARQELGMQFNAGHVLVGKNITGVSFWLNVDNGTPAGTINAYIRQADGTLITTSPDTYNANTFTGSLIEKAFTFSSTTLSATDMITVTATAVTGGDIGCETNAAAMTNGKCFSGATTGGPYSELINTQMKMVVTYAGNMDTQGEVTFYLQVVD
jgi:hypothetical protein